MINGVSKKIKKSTSEKILFKLNSYLNSAVLTRTPGPIVVVTATDLK